MKEVLIMNKDLGTMLVHLRKANKLSQKQFADILGVTSNAVGMWELNKRRPDVDMLKKIAIYYGVTTDSLLDLPLPETACSEEYLDNETKREYDLLKTFRLMNDESKDIAIAELKKILNDQHLREALSIIIETNGKQPD